MPYLIIFRRYKTSSRIFCRISKNADEKMYQWLQCVKQGPLAFTFTMVIHCGFNGKISFKSYSDAACEKTGCSSFLHITFQVTAALKHDIATIMALPETILSCLSRSCWERKSLLHVAQAFRDSCWSN